MFPFHEKKISGFFVDFKLASGRPKKLNMTKNDEKFFFKI